MMVVIFNLPRVKEIYYNVLMMVIIFLLPGAEEMCLLFAHDGCHFYASKSLLELY